MIKDYKDNVQDALKEIEKLNKMINDNPDMSSKKEKKN